MCCGDGTVVQIQDKKCRKLTGLLFFLSFFSKIVPKLAIKENREQHNTNTSVSWFRQG